jgi:hypothetical protein
MDATREDSPLRALQAQFSTCGARTKTFLYAHRANDKPENSAYLPDGS